MKPGLTTLITAPLATLIFSCGGEASGREANTAGVGALAPDPTGNAVSPLFGPEGLSSLLELQKSAEVIKASRELRERAEQEMRTDPRSAVETLATMARLGGTNTGMFAALRETSIQSLQHVLEQHQDADRYLQLGQEQFLAGRFEKARESLSAALEAGTLEPAARVEALCWSGAASQVLGDEAAATGSIERACEVVDQYARASQRPAHMAVRLQDIPMEEVYGDGLPSPDPNGMAPYSSDGTILGLGRGRQATAQGGFGSPSSAVAQEYTAARIAYEAEQARYESEVDLANSRAGRFGAQGVQINPRTVDQQVYLRYLNAKAAYEAASGK